MICFVSNKIIRGEIENKILRWETWFRTPFGLCRELYEARKVVEEANLDPRMSIIPVSVAIGSDTHEVYQL